MENSRVFKDFKGRKGGQVARKEEGERTKGVALQAAPATCRNPGVTGLFSRVTGKGGWELGPHRNQLSPGLRQREVIRLQAPDN